ncbi:13919_t:CDS:10 [Gigaspora rosea]|nr:13919_t:CDS:10 [Gigaspora rosea]
MVTVYNSLCARSSEESSISKTSAKDEIESESSDQTYNPSSDSEYSIKTKAKGSYYLDYFIGPGEIDWELKEDSIMWVIGEDISKICMKYRDNVIQKCISKEILSINEELALNYIFLFQEENPQGLYEYFDDELWKCAFSEIRTQYPYINIPENVFDLCGNVVKVMNKFKAFNRKFFNADGEFEEIMHKIFLIFDCYQNSFIVNNEIEDTHIQNYVNSVIGPFFPEGKKTTIDWANKISESSAQMMKKFDPSLAGSKPDFTIRTTNPKKFVELIQVTLGKTIRASLDKSLEDGVDLIVNYMLLVSEGVYQMILLGEFKFPKDPTTWGSLMSCFQILATIQDLVNKWAIKYQYATRKGSNQEIPSNIKLKRKCFIPR